jgi:hypothetical protein
LIDAAPVGAEIKGGLAGARSGLRTILPFDTETDAALYLLDEFRKGGLVSSNDIETAKAIIRGEEPMFVYEEKQPDGTLLLSLHDSLPPEGSNIVAFASRSAKTLAKFLLRRLHESKNTQASEETIRQAQSLMEGA